MSLGYTSKIQNEKALSYLFACAFVAFVALIPVRSILAQSTANELFDVNLKNVDIHTLIETVSSRTGKNFIVDPRVQATVTVVSSEPADAEKLYILFLSVLDVHGFAAVETGSFTKIVPSTVGVQSAVPVQKQQLDAADDLVTKVIQVKNVPVQDMAAVLRPLLPASASLSAEINTNTLLITDRVANIARLTELVRQLDRLN